jgi:hypothetical protein
MEVCRGGFSEEVIACITLTLPFVVTLPTLHISTRLSARGPLAVTIARVSVGATRIGEQVVTGLLLGFGGLATGVLEHGDCAGGLAEPA